MYSQDLPSDRSLPLSAGGRLGYDLVQISRIEESINHFGDSFKQRFFTIGELNYAHLGEGLCAQRLAARFAAKEAVIKALKLSEAGIGWREIEVRKLHDGDCEIVLHGRVAQLARAMGVAQVLVSMSHDGDYAGAMVSVVFAQADTPPEFDSLS
ncbi:MAG TPA: holo-ACP synthase [Rhodoferax sp.]|jgi:holo-[acyl-carrier protein] synthase|nr:holo-ACP synthase [Rhodoferax sp.]